MYKRQKYADELKRIILQRNSVNVYGSKGSGKTYVIKDFIEELKATNVYTVGVFDFNQYAGMSSASMVNALYDMCDVLCSETALKLMRFDVADRMLCKKEKRIPYCDRKLDNRLENYANVSDIASALAEELSQLSQLGATIKVAKQAIRLYNTHVVHDPEKRKIEEELSRLSVEELKEYLPEALAQDLGGIENEIVMIIDNYDTAFSEFSNHDWLRRIIQNTQKRISWVVISREELEFQEMPLLHVHVDELGDDDLLEYLEQEKNITDESIRNHILHLKWRNLFYIDYVLSYIDNITDKSKINWNEIQKMNMGFFVKEYLNRISSDRLEILYQLSYARHFDRELFQCLFPGRLFSMYEEWFRSTLFVENENGKYEVENGTKEELIPYLQSLSSHFKSECYYNLFRAEQFWFRKHMGTAKDNEVLSHLESLIIYGYQIDNRSEYIDALLSLKEMAFSSGCMMLFYEEMNRIASEDTNPHIRVTALKEKAMIALCCSNFAIAQKTIDEGVEIAEEINDWQKTLELKNIQLNLEYMASQDSDSAVDRCIQLAIEYIDYLEGKMQEIPYQTYVRSRMIMLTYLAKSYVIRKKFVEAVACLDEVLEVCNDVRKTSALSLYAICGKAQEQRGEIYGFDKNRTAAIQMYNQAIESYQVAEVLQPYWDSEFYLNFGLVYKRRAEEYFNLAQETEDRDANLEQANANIALALRIYDKVIARTPEMIDVYCKVNFACMTAIDFYAAEGYQDSAVEQYFQKGIAVLQSVELESFWNDNDMQDEMERKGNRQLCNGRTHIYLCYASYLAHKGEHEKAIAYFEDSLKAGADAIRVAEKHPYGYMESADAHATYAEYLIVENQLEKAKDIAAIGLQQIETAESFVDEGFASIKNRLLAILP